MEGGGRVPLVRGLALVATLGVLSLTLLIVNCGKQDLYSPPTSPFEIVGRLKLPSDNTGVDVLGDFAYVAGGQAGLHVVDISDPAHPVLRSTHDTRKRADAVKVIAAPQPDGSYLHIALVVEGTEGITTYNVTNPDSVVAFEAGSTAVDGKGMFIIETDDPSEPYYVYLAESWKGLRVFRSVPVAPGKLDYFGVFLYSRGYAKAVEVVDGFAYIADDEMGLTVMDARVLVPGQLEKVAYCDTPGNARDIEVVDGYAYISDGSGGLQILEVNEDETPVIVGSLALNGDSDAIKVRDGMAFVAADDGGLHVIDVRSPRAPVLMGSVLTPDAHDVALGNNGLVVIADQEGEIIIFRGPRAFEDVTAPGTVFNLSATPNTASSMELVWAASGDDGFVGQAASYDIRYHTESITTGNWDSAIQCTGEPVPSLPGEPETFLVTGLVFETQYYFALKVGDEVPLWSGISRVAIATTPSGVYLRDLSHSPHAATPESTVVYSVNYSHADGEPPVTYQVMIDGAPFDMTAIDTTYWAGAVFEYQAMGLEPGTHEYSFYFEDAVGNASGTETVTGPLVGVIIFEMGSPASEAGRNSDEVLHTVVLTRDIVVSAHEVTQSEYELRMGANPSRFAGSQRPVERVDWLDAIEYCNALSDANGYPRAYTVSGSDVTWDTEVGGWRLPTEAEWEYLCRAGTRTAFFTGDITEEACGLDASLDLAGWYCGNADSSTHEVGLKQANASGAYDTHGNVWEWCWDYYGPYDEEAIVIDPVGTETSGQRVVRGGSWYYHARDCRSACRGPRWPNSPDDVVGFRVVRNSD